MTVPTLSIVVICHNMRREAARTLYSLSPPYQTGVVPGDYEVIVIDNGSEVPLDAESVCSLGPNFRYRLFETESVSPAEAVNAGAAMAKGHLLAVIVDGARMATPGLVSTTLRAARIFDVTIVVALAWHLGPDVQNISILKGYDTAAEDKLLKDIKWQENGYDLFTISTISQSSHCGFLGGMPPECSWFCMARSDFLEMGGFDVRFQAGGGGLVNHDFRNRVLEISDLQPVVLLGEGVFHQYHGGIATNVPMDRHPMKLFSNEYESIRGVPYRPTISPPVYYFGTIPDQARRFLT